MNCSLNAICPYFTMYPLDFPLRVLAREKNKKKWIFDPYCGRGTTNFAARLLGMSSAGFDSSPVATAIAQAKLANCSSRGVLASLQAILREGKDPDDIPTGPFWDLAFHPSTLVDLCRIREELLRNSSSPSRKMLRAIVMGALHGPLSKGEPSYFSNQCPRTFAPKPAYAVKFWCERQMNPISVDIEQVVKRRANRFLAEPMPEIEGVVACRDSRQPTRGQFAAKFSWVITSPPYYGLRTYRQDQWLRYWFVGGPAEINYVQQKSDLEHSSAEDFTKQLRKVWKNSASLCHTGAKLVCRFGGINDRSQDSLSIIKNSFSESGWRLLTVRPAGSALSGTGEAADSAATRHGIQLEVVKHTQAKRGFVLLPRRWVVERSFAWAARFRRLARDYERLSQTLAAFHYFAFACLMLSKIFKILNSSR